MEGVVRNIKMEDRVLRAGDYVETPTGRVAEVIDVNADGIAEFKYVEPDVCELPMHLLRRLGQKEVRV